MHSTSSARTHRGQSSWGAQTSTRPSSCASRRPRPAGACSGSAMLMIRMLLNELWANAAAYVHGHSVGGTNPSLLQALGAGAPTLALDTALQQRGAALLRSAVLATTPPNSPRGSRRSLPRVRCRRRCRSADGRSSVSDTTGATCAARIWISSRASRSEHIAVRTTPPVVSRQQTIARPARRTRTTGARSI